MATLADMTVIRNLIFSKGGSTSVQKSLLQHMNMSIKQTLLTWGKDQVL